MYVQQDVHTRYSIKMPCRQHKYVSLRPERVGQTNPRCVAKQHEQQRRNNTIPWYLVCDRPTTRSSSSFCFQKEWFRQFLHWNTQTYTKAYTRLSLPCTYRVYARANNGLRQTETRMRDAPLPACFRRETYCLPRPRRRSRSPSSRQAARSSSPPKTPR